MTARVQTTVQNAIASAIGWMQTAPAVSDANPRGDRLSYLWLASGIVLFPFAGVRWTIPLAAWLLPVFWLRFVRAQPTWRGSLMILLASVLVALIDLQGVVPVTGIYYVLMVVAVCALGVLPYLIDRLLEPRLGGLLGTLVFPLAVTTVAYFGAALSPIGTFGNVAYTQYGDLPLLQLASLTGLWGIVFLMSWFASVVNWAWERGFAWPQIRRCVFLYCGLLGLVLICGGARLAFAAALEQGATVRIAGVSPSRSLSQAASQQFSRQVSMQSWMSLTSAMGASAQSERERAAVAPVFARAYAPVNDDLLARSEQEARAGAKIIVWPEAGAQVLQEDEPALVAKASALARATGVYLEMGIGELLQHPTASGMMLDQTILMDPSGNVVWRYEKVHLVPGAETSMVVPGVDRAPTASTPYGRISNVICFDADFPDTLRQAGQAGADIMLVPSNDWREIDPYHTQLITFRAIEDGYALVRQTSNGLAMTVDYTGRTLAASDYFASDAQVMVASVPMHGVRTVYATIGDLFAWLSIAGLLALIGAVSIRRRSALSGAVVADASTSRASRLDVIRFLSRHPIGGYFVLAYAGTWTVLLPAVLSRDGIGALPFRIPFAIFALLFIGAGLAGPTLGAFIMTSVTLGRPGVRAFLRRYLLWRVGVQWYVAVLFGQMGVYLLIAVIALGPGSIQSLATKWPLIFVSYLPLVLTYNLSTAIGEEPGWRGYALPRLQERYGPLPASLILGTLHAGWHLPVFFLPAIGLGPLSLSFVATWLPSLWATTVLWTWIFNNAQGSILVAILLHSAYDAAGAYVFETIINVTALSAAAGNRVTIAEMVIFVALAALVLALTRGRLSYTPAHILQPISSATSHSSTEGHQVG